MAEMGQPVVVAGATGYAGRHVVAELARRGHRVRAITRSAGRAASTGPVGAPALEGPGVELAVGDVSDPAFQRGVCEGAGAVVSALGVTRQRADPWDIDFRANLGLLTAAERAGVTSMVYVGVMHAEQGRSRILRAKHAFMQVLRRSPVAGAIVNPSGFFSDVGEYLTMARRGVVAVPGTPARIQPIHGADLARFCVDRLGQDGAWDVGGPDVLTHREIAELAVSASGGRARILPVPSWGISAADRVAAHIGGHLSVLTEFFAEGLRHDAVGEAVGEHRLADHLAQLADGTARPART